MIKAEITNLPQTVRRSASEVMDRFRGLELNEAEAKALHQRIDERTRIKPEKGVKVTLPKDGANNDITTTLTKAQAIELRNKLLVALQELESPDGCQTVLLTLDNVRSLNIHTPTFRRDRPLTHDASLEAERATFAFAFKSPLNNEVERLLHVFERPRIDIKAGYGY